MGVRTLQGFTCRDIRAQPKGSGIFFSETWVSFVEPQLNDCRRCRAEIMSLTVLRVFHIHGPMLLLMLSKAVHGFNTHQSHISGTQLRASSLKVENSSSVCRKKQKRTEQHLLI